MLEKKIKFTDFDGNQREEVFRFNLSKAEIMEMELGTAGGMTKLIETLVAKEDHPRLIQLYKDIILKSYGEKSPDGRRFVKSQELRDAFEQTDAYSELYMELITDKEAAAEFVHGIMPNQQSMELTADHKKPELTLTETVE